MSRKAVTLTLLVYVVAAISIASVIEVMKPLAKVDLITVSSAFGAGLGLFIIAGIIPMIAWAFARFRAERATGPLVVWAILGIVVGMFSAMGTRYDAAEKIDRWSEQLNLTGKDRAEFVGGANRSCIQNQRQSGLNRQVGVTEKQITDYCDCFANSLTTALTAEDLKFYAVNGKPSDIAQQKIDGIQPTCTAIAFGRGR